MSLGLVESFLSIQGEGKYAGRLAIFLRFFGCNLHCKGFGVQLKSPKTGEILTGCDTIRAVSNHFKPQLIENVEQLGTIIKNLSAKKAQKPIIVITGGEPLIHHKNDIFYRFLTNFLLKYEVHFETNGTIEVDFDKFPEYKKCKFAVSIKLENSGESEAKRINERALKAIKANASESFYKFVVRGDESELKQIEKILAVCENDVWLMPLGASRVELAQNATRVAQLSIKQGYNYCERIHIRLWDKKEGV